MTDMETMPGDSQACLHIAQGERARYEILSDDGVHQRVRVFRVKDNQVNAEVTDLNIKIRNNAVHLQTVNFDDHVKVSLAHSEGDSRGATRSLARTRLKILRRARLASRETSGPAPVVIKAVARLQPADRERYQEEWMADYGEIRGRVRRWWWSVGLRWSAYRLAKRPSDRTRIVSDT